MNKKIVILVIILIFLNSSLLIFMLNKPKQNAEEIPSISNTPSQIEQGSPLPKSSTLTKPPVKYDNIKSDQLLQIIKDRPALLQTDLEARNKLVDSLHGQSGVLNRTTFYELYYLKTANVFQAEILSVNYLEAKAQVVLWLKEQGLSVEGICKLPLDFFLNTEVADQLRDRDIVINPLPEEC